MGEHGVKKGLEPLNLYMATSPPLVHRYASLGPVRSLSQPVTGFLTGPYGFAAICFCNTVSANEMGSSWDPLR